MKRFLLTLAVLACFGAYAVSFDISTGDLTITSAGSWDVTGTTTAHSIIINTADAVNITLDNVSITDVSCAFDIQSGTVYLSLTGNNTLTSTAAAGLHVASDASLAITGDGSLTATSQGEEGAGIGSNKRENSGEVIITSGTITANGATYAAGIGGGGHGCANVMIEGGVVKATSGWLGAGIGGGTGWEGGAGSVTINGGFVKAEGNNGAGIGCGDEGGRIDPGTVVINGGTVEAHAGSGAGIG
ncbi:MAG: carbohydrate-binding domain-containing protein, partial [Fibrobacter sp.]|nr:carbohydrate-binding domain-containing protein [Fibrobacter sp.]